MIVAIDYEVSRDGEGKAVYESPELAAPRCGSNVLYRGYRKTLEALAVITADPTTRGGEERVQHELGEDGSHRVTEAAPVIARRASGYPEIARLATRPEM